jgi:ribosomal protein L11 methyltransferase
VTRWRNVILEVRAERASDLADALLEAGAVSVSIDDADAETEHEVARFGEPGAEPDLWPHCRVTALCPSGLDPSVLLAAAAAATGLAPPPAIRIEEVPDDDWVKRSQAQFSPIEVTPDLWIVPSWHEPPEPEALSIRLDPGLAFGTGGHPTTLMCLRWLAEHLRGGERVLDYGCGSGILAIAAARLGAAAVTGVDIDADAVASARLNAQANGVAGTFGGTDTPLGDPFDVTVANILARPLLVLAPLLAEATRPGGSLVLAGLLARQAEEIADAYRPWFDVAHYAEEADWVCLHGIRRVRTKPI